MSNMTLGSYTFDSNPSTIDGILVKQRSVAGRETYSGAVVFSWGALWEGRRITLEWDFMTTAMYDELQTLYEADAAVVFDPADGSPADTFNVELMNLTGAYHLYLEGGTGRYRRDVKLELMVLSEAS